MNSLATADAACSFQIPTALVQVEDDLAITVKSTLKDITVFTTGIPFAVDIAPADGIKVMTVQVDVCTQSDLLTLEIVNGVNAIDLNTVHDVSKGGILIGIGNGQISISRVPGIVIGFAIPRSIRVRIGSNLGEGCDRDLQASDDPYPYYRCSDGG